jgi:hypothetical protein
MKRRYKKKSTFWIKKKHLSEEHKLKIGNANKRHNVSDETRRKISEKMSGRKLSDIHRQRLRENHKGFDGKRHSVETLKKISGFNSKSWLGGKSFEKYGLDWNKRLRNNVRKRDNFICKLCGIKQGKKKLSVHHIDYNKKNNNLNNLICLCNSCHIKTNFNREYWIKHFKSL